MWTTSNPSSISILIMAIQAGLRPPATAAWVPSNPFSTKRLHASTSCPAFIQDFSSSDEEEYNCQDNDNNDASPRLFEPFVDMQDDADTLSMECSSQESVSTPEPAVVDNADSFLHQPKLVSPAASIYPSSDLSDRRKLQWEFVGLTLWIELEEFDNDITRAVEDFSARHSSPFIPKPHMTAIYGFDHLSPAEAAARLQRVPAVLGPGGWPSFSRPTGVVSDIAVCGRPGQVCSIAWAELTMASGPAHEDALDALHGLFFGEDWRVEHERERPWKPHCSIAYDNPDTNRLSLLDTVVYASRSPTLLAKERRVEAISLWSTQGKMEEWICLDRVRL